MPRHGAVLLRGGDVCSAEDFDAVSNSLNCEAYDYIRGAVPRTELVPGVVFTSSESHPDQAILSATNGLRRPRPVLHPLLLQAGLLGGWRHARHLLGRGCRFRGAHASGVQPEARQTQRAVRARVARGDRQRVRVVPVVERDVQHRNEGGGRGRDAQAGPCLPVAS